MISPPPIQEKPRFQGNQTAEHKKTDDFSSYMSIHGNSFFSASRLLNFDNSTYM
jgi:hypothetical protein